MDEPDSDLIILRCQECNCQTDILWTRKDGKKVCYKCKD